MKPLEGKWLDYYYKEIGLHCSNSQLPLHQNSKDIHTGLDLFENEKSFKDNTGLLESLDPS